MPHSNNLCYEFGPFTLNEGQRVLTRDGEVIPLTPKATEVLLCLLRRPGELIEKEDLMREVWPEAFVEEGNLTQNIFTLRRALGDQRSEAQYIETVVRRGYRFIGAVRRHFLNETEPERAVPSELPVVLAVLPFANATGDDDMEYLAEGVTDNIINGLSQMPKLRVMSRSALFRYHTGTDPTYVATELPVDAVLVGKIVSRPIGMIVKAELVNANKGWLIWGDSIDTDAKDILQIQEEINRKILTALRLKPGEEEKSITARYTDNPRAYKAYIEGRAHWSRFTPDAVIRAIVHFRSAIKFDPNYALGYASIIDCYLRLVTNYFPHESRETTNAKECREPLDHKVRLRHEWDWRGAERELRRANDLKRQYPRAHQWHAAYQFVRELCESHSRKAVKRTSKTASQRELPLQIALAQLTPSEEVQVFCAIARDQIDIGNYEAAGLILKRWWQLGDWPRLTGLDFGSCADLLFTAGELAGFDASAHQIPTGQKNAENLLSGSIASFEQLGSHIRAAEGRMELALCYYRQGNFDLCRDTFQSVLSGLAEEQFELRSLTLIRLASLERHAGRLQDALTNLAAARKLVELVGPWVSARYHLELASTYKDLGVVDKKKELLDLALQHYGEALSEFEAIGNFRMVAIADNNLGFLLLTLGKFQGAQLHLSNARKMFERLKDRVRRAQVDDTLARLYLAQSRLDLAEEAVNQAIEILESGDEDILLAEVLSTKGIVYARLGRHGDAERIFERAHATAIRRGDREGAARSLLLAIEEIGDSLSAAARIDAGIRLRQLAAELRQSSIFNRLEGFLNLV